MAVTTEKVRILATLTLRFSQVTVKAVIRLTKIFVAMGHALRQLLLIQSDAVYEIECPAA